VIGLDTNILVRYIAQDDAVQSPKATALMEQLSETEPGFISLVSLVELAWVIQGCYSATKAETVAILEKLLRVQTLCVENADVVFKAVRSYAGSNADFADCLIERSAHHANCTRTMTFDQKAAKTAGMHLL
jgi:predicted nucleic-acid-binding protein